MFLTLNKIVYEMRKYLIIPHLEPCISPWLLSEYRFVVELFKGSWKVVFTNVRNVKDFNILKSLGCEVFNDDFNIYIEREGIKNVLVLDPQAREVLVHDDVIKSNAVIIGGIMGDHPPRGRTKKLITDKLKVSKLVRNLGSKQLTIAGAAYVLKRVSEGVSVSDVELIDGLSIRLEIGGTELIIELPYVFPAIKGKPVLPKDYIEVIKGATQYFETYLVGRCLDEAKASR